MTKNKVLRMKSEFFSAGIENFCDRFITPQTSNQIDASDTMHVGLLDAPGPSLHPSLRSLTINATYSTT